MHPPQVRTAAKSPPCLCGNCDWGCCLERTPQPQRPPPFASQTACWAAQAPGQVGFSIMQPRVKGFLTVQGQALAHRA